MAKFTAATLNLGRCKGVEDVDGITPTYRWMMENAAAGFPAQVMVFQDFPSSALGLLRHRHEFLPLCIHWVDGVRMPVGICVVSRIAMGEKIYGVVHGDGTLKVLKGITRDSQHDHAVPNVQEVLYATEDRYIMACTLGPIGDNRRNSVRFATYHGLYAPGGVLNDQQQASTRRLLEFIAEDKGRKRQGMVVLGDTNPDKGGWVNEQLLAAGAKIYVPDCHSTLSPRHGAYRFGPKPDCFMVFPNDKGEYPCVVQDMYLDDSPHSDHQLVGGKVVLTD